MQFTFGLIALLLNFIGYIPYIRDIIGNKVKPHRITWGIWLILTSVAAINQVLNQGGYSSLFFISTTFLVATVFVLSFKHGMGGATRIDRICLILSILLLIYWVTIRDTRLSTVFAVIIDGIGALPTAIKTYHHPDTETYIQWVLAGIAGLITMIAIPRFDWVLIIYPFYVFVMNAAIVVIKYLSEKKQ